MKILPMASPCAHCKIPHECLYKLSTCQKDVRACFREKQDEDQICQKCMKRARALLRRKGIIPYIKKKKVDSEGIHIKKNQTDILPNNQKMKRVTFSQLSVNTSPPSNISPNQANNSRIEYTTDISGKHIKRAEADSICERIDKDENKESFSQPTLHFFPPSMSSSNPTNSRRSKQTIISISTYIEENKIIDSFSTQPSMNYFPPSNISRNSSTDITEISSNQIKNTQIDVSISLTNDKDKKRESFSQKSIHISPPSIITENSNKQADTTGKITNKTTLQQSFVHSDFAVSNTSLTGKKMRSDLSISNSGDIFAECSEKNLKIVTQKENNKQIISISPECCEIDENSESFICRQDTVIWNTERENVNISTHENIESEDCFQISTVERLDQDCEYCKIHKINMPATLLEDEDNLCKKCQKRARSQMNNIYDLSGNSAEGIQSNDEAHESNLTFSCIKPCRVLVTPLSVEVLQTYESSQTVLPAKKSCTSKEVDIIKTLVDELADLIKRPRHSKRKVVALRKKITNMVVQRKMRYLIQKSKMPYTIPEVVNEEPDNFIQDTENVNTQKHTEEAKTKFQYIETINNKSLTDAEKSNVVEESYVIECDDTQNIEVQTQHSIVCEDTQENNIENIRDCSQSSVASDDVILPSYDTTIYTTKLNTITSINNASKLFDPVTTLNSKTGNDDVINQISSQNHKHLLENDSECFHFSDLSRLINNEQVKSVNTRGGSTSLIPVEISADNDTVFEEDEIPYVVEVEVHNTKHILHQYEIEQSAEKRLEEHFQNESNVEAITEIIGKTNNANRKSSSTLKRLRSEDDISEHVTIKKKKIEQAETLISLAVDEPMQAVVSPSTKNINENVSKMFKKPMKILCKQSKIDPLHITHIGQLIDINIKKMKCAVYCKHQDEMGNYHQVFKNEKSLADPVCTVSNCTLQEPYFKFTSFLTVGSSELELNGTESHRNLFGLPSAFLKIVLNLLYSVGSFYYHRKNDNLNERPLQIQFLQLLAETIPKFQPSTILFQNVSNEKSTSKHAYLRGIESSKDRFVEAQNVSSSKLEQGLMSKTKLFLARGSGMRERTIQIKRNIRICRNEHLVLSKADHKPCEESVDKNEKLSEIELKISDLQCKLKKISAAEISYRKDIKQSINI